MFSCDEYERYALFDASYEAGLVERGVEHRDQRVGCLLTQLGLVRVARRGRRRGRAGSKSCGFIGRSLLTTTQMLVGSSMRARGAVERVDARRGGRGLGAGRGVGVGVSVAAEEDDAPLGGRPVTYPDHEGGHGDQREAQRARDDEPTALAHLVGRLSALARRHRPSLRPRMSRADRGRLGGAPDRPPAGSAPSPHGPLRRAATRLRRAGSRAIPTPSRRLGTRRPPARFHHGSVTNPDCESALLTFVRALS